MHIKKNNKNKTMITTINTMIKIDKAWTRDITITSLIQMVRSMVITARAMMIKPQMLRDLILPQWLLRELTSTASMMEDLCTHMILNSKEWMMASQRDLVLLSIEWQVAQLSLETLTLALLEQLRMMKKAKITIWED